MKLMPLIMINTKIILPSLLKKQDMRLWEYGLDYIARDRVRGDELL
jgi:hypothetical protein